METLNEWCEVDHFIVTTGGRTWGRGKTLSEAFANAQVSEVTYLGEVMDCWEDVSHGETFDSPDTFVKLMKRAITNAKSPYGREDSENVVIYFFDHQDFEKYGITCEVCQISGALQYSWPIDNPEAEKRGEVLCKQQPWQGEWVQNDDIRHAHLMKT